MLTLTNCLFAIVASFQAARSVSGAGAQDHCVTDACIKPVRDHSLMQREVRGLRDELRALSQAVHDGAQDRDGTRGIIDTIMGGSDDSSASDSPEHTKKHHGGNHSNSTSKHHNGSNHSKEHGGHSDLAKGSCVVTHWVSDHDGQHGTITDVKKNGKFFSVFFKDQHKEWIPHEYLSPTACPKIQVHDCVKVDWVSDHDGELGTVVDMQEHHGEEISRVQFKDDEEEWIPTANLNYSFQSCPPIGLNSTKNDSNSSAHTVNHSHKHSNVSAHGHNHSHNTSHEHSHKNESNSSANHSHNMSHEHSHKNKSNSTARQHNHSHNTSHERSHKNKSNSSAQQSANRSRSKH
eukprot:TRINITY_DN4546_c0_g2_i1.p1 TRINITY_DN4546_c0_g2~~TRINITY_DN4546_c0_g2_i1.p1  ORF type:complete len:348 (+),score=37.80 TRINITY_DN4546_c0_g2_i1:69-1112(+)